MALINTTTTGILGTTVYGDGAGALTVQENGVQIAKVTNNPTFLATSASATVSSGVNTKCTVNYKYFDTDSRFNATGSTVGGIPAYAFMPNVAGYYQVNLAVSGNGSSSTGRVFAWIYKNGSAFTGASTAPQGNTNTGMANISVVLHFNGTTDYLEAYGNVEGSGTLTMNGSAQNSFSATLVKAA